MQGRVKCLSVAVPISIFQIPDQSVIDSWSSWNCATNWDVVTFEVRMGNDIQSVSTIGDYWDQRV